MRKKEIRRQARSGTRDHTRYIKEQGHLLVLESDRCEPVPDVDRLQWLEWYDEKPFDWPDG